MTKRRKDILKRKYIAPEVYFEQTEPWEMIAATMQSPNMPGGGNYPNPFGPKPQNSKENSNLFFYDDEEGDFYEDEFDE